jgi:hypothetical protein
VILDDDKLGQTPQRDQRIAGVAADADLHVIWQNPCHEAVLLRHLEGCAQLRPSSTNLAGQQLAARWAGYEKAMPAARLAKRLDQAAIARAAAVEPNFAELFHVIGLV